MPGVEKEGFRRVDAKPSIDWIEAAVRGDDLVRGVPHGVVSQSLHVMRWHFYAAESEPVREMVRGKVTHSLDVVRATSAIVAQTPEIRWNIPQTLVIGLAHDLGRFPQAHLGSLNDAQTNFDHGTVGADIFGNFDLAGIDVDAAVATKAIQRHNKAEAGTDDPYALLIRDADKLALFRDIVATDAFIVDQGSAAPVTVASAVKEAFLAGTPVLNADLRTPADHVMRMLAWITDIRYPATQSMIVQEGLLQQILGQLAVLTDHEDPDIRARVEAWQRKTL